MKRVDVESSMDEDERQQCLKQEEERVERRKV